MRPARAPLVFIHGFKGSVLRDARGRVRWISAAQALGLATPRLALPLAEGSSVESAAAETLFATEPLSHITIGGGWLWRQPVYDAWLRAARLLERPFYSFCYDWRQSNLRTLAEFRVFCEAVNRRHGNQGLQAVGHSNGGLIALALLNAQPRLFRGAVFVGTPFRGGLGFLPDLDVGTRAGLNRRLLAPEVLGSFPSVYSFFPLDGQGLVDERGEALPIDFFDPVAWEQNKWGLFKAPTGKGTALAAARGFLTRALAEAREFRRQMIPLEQDYPPLAVIAGGAQATLHEVRREGGSWDYQVRPKTRGDGRIALANARPSAGLRHHYYESRLPHHELLNDPAIFTALRDTVGASC